MEPQQNVVDELSTQFSRTSVGLTTTEQEEPLSGSHINYTVTTTESISTISVTRPSTAIDDTIVNVLFPAFKGFKDQLTNPMPDTCLWKVLEFACKWDLYSKAVFNCLRLASGNPKFPVIVLLNPWPKHEHGTFEVMMRNCPTLAWIEKTISSAGRGVLGLEITEICIVDAFSLLDDELVKKIEGAGGERAVEQARWEAMEITNEILKALRPDIIIACQCSSSGPKWDNSHRLADDLCSKVANASNSVVREMTLDGHKVDVVQAFHPQYFMKNRDANKEQILKEILHKLYRPCALWKFQLKRHQEMQATIEHLKVTLQDVRNVHQRLSTTQEGQQDTPISIFCDAASNILLSITNILSSTSIIHQTEQLLAASVPESPVKTIQRFEMWAKESNDDIPKQFRIIIEGINKILVDYKL